MKVDLRQILTYADGTEMKDSSVRAQLLDGTLIQLENDVQVKLPTGETVKIDFQSKSKTLAEILLTALNTGVNDDRSETPENKYKRWQLSCAIQMFRDNEECEISREDSIVLEKRVNSVFLHPAIYGRVKEMFDSASPSTDK